MINKIGGDRVLAIYWFIMFVIVIIGLVSGVSIFFSKPLDIREAEGNILADKLTNCFIDNGIYNNSLMDRAKSDGLEEVCGLVLEDKTGYYENSNEQYYLEFKIEDKIASSNDAVKSKLQGFCEQEDLKKNIPACVNRDFFVLKDDKFEKVEILVIVDKVKQNAL